MVHKNTSYDPRYTKLGRWKYFDLDIVVSVRQLDNRSSQLISIKFKDVRDRFSGVFCPFSQDICTLPVRMERELQQ